MMHCRTLYVILALALASNVPSFVRANSEHKDVVDQSTPISMYTVDEYNRAISQLDEATFVVQYLAQVITKKRNDISLPPARIIRQWVLKVQERIREIKKINSPTRDHTVKSIVCSARSLLIYLSLIMENKFEELPDFELPVIEESSDEQSDQKFAEYDAIQQMLFENDKMLKQLQEKTRTVGLTKMNLFARKLDAWNDRWGFTKILESLPQILGIGGMLIYLIPQQYCQRFGLRWVKRHIGNPDYYDRLWPQHSIKLGQTAAGLAAPATAALTAPATVTAPAAATLAAPSFLAAPAAAAPLFPAAANPVVPAAPLKEFVLSEFLGGNDYKTVKHLGFLALAACSGSLTAPVISPIKSYIRNQWNKLKGFDVPADTRFKYIDFTLDDPSLIGLEEQVAEMKQVADYITNPTRYNDTDCSPQKGILFTGRSRAGKTLLAKATAGTLNKKFQDMGMINKFAFIEVSWSEIRYSAEGIKSVIKRAKDNAPCILFIDEIHNLPLQTKEGGDILTDFLTMSDTLASTDARDTVFVIGATNKPHLLDPALYAAGRFGKIVRFDGANKNKRKNHFTQLFVKNSMNPHDLEIDLDALTRQTQGASLADVDLIFKAARFGAATRRVSIKQSDFTNVIYKHLWRLRLENTLPLSDAEKKLISAHIAGKVLIYLLHEQDMQEVLEVATIGARWNEIQEKRYFDVKLMEQPTITEDLSYGHVITTSQSETLGLQTAPKLSCKALLAGSVAEALLLGSCSYTYRPEERRQALDILEKIEFKGLKKEDYTKDEQKTLMNQAAAGLRDYEREVRDVLTEKRTLLEKIATRLAQGTIVTKAELRALIEAA